MSLVRSLLPLLAVVVALTGVATGCCGSSGDSSSESSAAAQGTPTATSTTPEAPPGASWSCEGTVAGTKQLRVTGTGCDVARGVVAAWTGKPACTSPTSASRFSCSVGDYRCLAAAAEGGTVVSCSRPGSSIAFIARRG